MTKINNNSFLENDIRPEQLMREKKKYIDADRQFLLSRKNGWVDVACPACDSAQSSFYGEKQGFIYVECNSCKTVYTNPRPTTDLMHEFYRESLNYAYWNKYVFPATEDARRKHIFHPRAKRVADNIKRLNISRNVLLEVGAGFGLFCEELRNEIAFNRTIALEPTPDLAETCRSRGLEVMEMFVEQVSEEHFADVVVAFEVIEHLFSPRKFISHCARLLNPQGLLILTCPNVLGFDISTLGILSNTFDHEHVNYFHIGSLPLLLQQCGFQILDVQTPGFLDAELVRKHVFNGTLDLKDQAFMKQVLVDRWDELGSKFQSFLSENRLSSHMWVVARSLAK